MAIEKVREYLKGFKLDNKIKEFNVSSATVDLAAEALGCEGKRIAKTLSFIVEGSPILIVTSGDTKIDNPKFKELFKCKATMIPFDDVERLIGHGVGGVCPFGINEGVKVYLDISLKRFNTVFPACGSSNSAIELSIEDLEKTSGYESWIDVCKSIE